MIDHTHLTKWQAEFLSSYCGGLVMWGAVEDTVGLAAIWLAFFVWLGLRLRNLFRARHP